MSLEPSAGKRGGGGPRALGREARGGSYEGQAARTALRTTDMCAMYSDDFARARACAAKGELHGVLIFVFMGGGVGACRAVRCALPPARIDLERMRE